MDGMFEKCVPGGAPELGVRGAPAAKTSQRHFQMRNNSARMQKINQRTDTIPPMQAYVALTSGGRRSRRVTRRGRQRHERRKETRVFFETGPLPFHVSSSGPVCRV